jgi:signal transduction histidine kinase
MVVSAVWIAPAALATIDRIAQQRLSGDPPVGAFGLLWAAGDWLVYAILTPAVFWLANRWPIARPRIASRVALHLGIALLFCVAWAVGGKLLQLGLRFAFDNAAAHAFVASQGDKFWPTLGRDALSWIFTTMPFGVVVYLTVLGMAHAIRYFTEARERDVQNAMLSEQLSSARFSALQAQLNPHFLFNTLNTIAVRARDGDGAGTARMVEQLSEVLRRTLSRHRANEVTLEEELELVRQYLAIEQARFSDRLVASFEVDEALQAAAVPGFALQHLVENAIRHGIAKRSGAGRMQVSARRDGDWLVLSVADDGAGVSAAQVFPAGHGIDNTRGRLRALYGGGASLEVARRDSGGTMATLRVPYRELAVESDVTGR